MKPEFAVKYQQQVTKPRNEVELNAALDRIALNLGIDPTNHAPQPSHIHRGTNFEQIFKSIAEIDQMGEALKPGALHFIEGIGREPETLPAIENLINNAIASGEDEKVLELIRVGNLMGLNQYTQRGRKRWGILNLFGKATGTVPPVIDDNEYQRLYDYHTQQIIQKQQVAQAQAAAARRAAQQQAAQRTTTRPRQQTTTPPRAQTTGPTAGSANPSVNPTTRPATNPTTNTLQEEPLTGKSAEWITVRHSVDQTWQALVAAGLPQQPTATATFTRFEASMKIVHEMILGPQKTSAEELRATFAYLLVHVWKEKQIFDKFFNKYNVTKQNVANPNTSRAQSLSGLDNFSKFVFIPESLRTLTTDPTTDQVKLINRINRQIRPSLHEDSVRNTQGISPELVDLLLVLSKEFSGCWAHGVKRLNQTAPNP